MTLYQSFPGTNGGSSAFMNTGGGTSGRQYLSRGLPDDEQFHQTVSYGNHGNYAHSLTPPNSFLYDTPNSFGGYSETDHVRHKPGGDKTSPRHGLTQSHHAHHNYSASRPPFLSSHSYHAPPTAPSNHQRSRDRHTYSGSHASPYRYHGDRYRGLHDERQHDLTTSVRISSSSGQSNHGQRYDWLTQSWTQPSANKPHPSSHYPRDTPASPLGSRSDSSPPVHPRVSRPPTHFSNGGVVANGGVPYVDIISHPKNVIVPPDGRLALTCEARLLHTSDLPVYQWYKDEEPLLGEVESTLVKEKVTEEDMGFYFCIVSDVGGVTQRKSTQAYVCMDDEDPSPINVPSPPVIIEQPATSVTIPAGGRLHLKLQVTGFPEPTYRWFRNGVELPHSCGRELLVPCMTVRDEGIYMCSIKNEWGSTLTGDIAVKLLQKETKRSSSDSQIMPFCDDIEDSEIALPPSYTAPSSPRKHAHSFRPVVPPASLLFVERSTTVAESAEVTDAVLSLVANQLKRQLDLYRFDRLALCLGISTYDLATIRVSCSSVDGQLLQVLHSWRDRTHQPTVDMLEELLRSEGFMVSIPHSEKSYSALGSSPPIIQDHPRNVHASLDSTVKLYISAEGDAPLHYQWYRNNKPLPHHTSSQLVLYEIQEDQRGLYHCIVTNRHGNATSRPAHVTVAPQKIKLPPSLQPSEHRGGTHPNYLYCSQGEKPVGRYSPLCDPFFLPIARRGSGDSASLPSLDSMGSSHMFPGDSCQVGGGATPAGVMEMFDSLKLGKSSKPVITEHPLSQEVAIGEPLQLSVAAESSDNVIHYIWYFNGLALGKETYPEFFLNCFTEEDVGDYYCEVSNSNDKVKSDIAKITLKEEADEQEEKFDNKSTSFLN